MKYRADTQKMQSAVTDFKSAENSMNGLVQRLNAVKGHLTEYKQLEGLIPAIENRIKAVSKIKDALGSSGNCLNLIRTVYIDAEKRVSIISVLFNWLKKLFDRNKSGGKKPGGGSGGKPGVSPEHAADIRMRNESLALLREYEDKWRAARTEAEKKALLTQLLAKIQNILGTRANPNINFASLGGGTLGSYTPRHGLITINTNMLNSHNSIRLLKTIIHEARHAYQYEAAFQGRHPSVSNETRQIWRDNFQNYTTGSGNEYDKYYNQPIERDAFWFSGHRDDK